jgi:hypothetical protein
VGKTLERIIRDQVSAFLDNAGVIPANQHGFRTRRFCVTLLTGTLESWATTLDERAGAHVHAAFLDWQKALDRVPHARLLSKCEFYGIKGPLLCWLEKFLVGRIQFVRYGGAESSPAEVPSGVIQGSVLGPLLFKIYVADLISAIKNSTLILYADDCTLYKEVIVEDADSVDEMQEDLENVAIWCANNGMTLNLFKYLFSTDQYKSTRL